MQYAVIYTVDTSDFEVAEWYAPDKELGLTKTEGNEQFETPDCHPSWEKGTHGKWCGILDEEEFAKFVADNDLSTNGEEGTALGAIGLGFSKAVVFQGLDDEDVISEAWVTPFCDEEDLAEWLREHGERVPAKIADSPGQRYLFRGVKDKREPFKVVAGCLARMFS